MSVSLQIIVKHTPINLQNKEEVSAIIIDTFEKCKEYCRENRYNEEECEYSIEDENNIWIDTPFFMIYLRPDYWNMFSCWGYRDYFSCIEEEFYTRNQTYKYVKLLEESECWICDEYHLDQGWHDYDDIILGTLENWKKYIKKRQGDLPDFCPEDFKDSNPLNSIIKIAYHDRFRDFHDTQ